MQDYDTDEALMQAYAAGNTTAFETLYQRRKDGLYRFLLRQLRDTAQAEELLQEVWLTVIRQRQAYRRQGRFVGWLYQIARSRCLDHFRRLGVRPVTSDVSPDELTNGRNPEFHAGQTELAGGLIEAIEALPLEQREAFLLREEAGLSLAEIAEVTAVNTETAKSRLRYAISKLRQALEVYRQ